MSKPLGDGAQRKKEKVEAKLTQNTKKKKIRPEAETGEEESWTAYKFPEACVL